MTSNLDDFDDPELAPAAQPAQKPKGLAAVRETWQRQPMFKLVVIMIAAAAFVAALLGIFSSNETVIETSAVGSTPGMREAPGGTAPPAFQEAVRAESQARAEQALQAGGSALPTPLGAGVNLSDLERQALGNENDPLAEFRAESIREAEVALPPPLPMPTVRTEPVRADPELQGQMQAQMQTLIDTWTPSSPQIISVMTEGEGAGLGGDFADETFAGDDLPQEDFIPQKPIVAAGSVLYAQLLTEANSDVPGPIMARVLSGPFNGGRAIGGFEVTREYLVLRFNNINLRGVDYPVDVIAVDPDTTLGGLATEVDNRYFSRVILPAAASFIEAFGDTFAQEDTSVTVSGDTVIQERASQSIRDGIYAGLGESFSTVGSFLRDEAAQIRPLVRVAVGTPLGLFFTQSIYDGQ